MICRNGCVMFIRRVPGFKLRGTILGSQKMSDLVATNGQLR